MYSLINKPDQLLFLKLWEYELDFFQAASMAAGADSLKKSNFLFLLFSKVLRKALDQANCHLLENWGIKKINNSQKFFWRVFPYNRMIGVGFKPI